MAMAMTKAAGDGASPKVMLFFSVHPLARLLCPEATWHGYRGRAVERAGPSAQSISVPY